MVYRGGKEKKKKELERKKKVQKVYDPDVIRTRNLLIWSQTRYRCATESQLLGFSLNRVY